MQTFIFPALMVVSFGVMVFLVARKTPQVSDVAADADAARTFTEKFDRFLHKLPLEKVDLFVSEFLERNLRKLRLFILRLDNALNKHLEKMLKLKRLGVRGGIAGKPALFERKKEGMEATEEGVFSEDK